MADLALLPGVDVTAPRPSQSGAVDSGGSGGVNQLVDVIYANAYTCWTPEECAAQWAAEQLPEVVVVAPPITPPPLLAEPIAPTFQGPFPEPSPAPSPSPGGGGVPTETKPQSTAAEPARSPYSVEKPGLLRTARFIIEQLLARMAPAVRNIIPRLPTPATFLGEALLIGDKVADATLFDPRTINQPDPINRSADTYTTLPEQMIWPQVSSSPNTPPMRFDLPSPSMSNSWSPSHIWEPEQFDVPLPSPSITTAPLPLSLAQPAPLPLSSPIALSAPISPLQPTIMDPVPMMPASPAPSPISPTLDPAPFYPGLDTPSKPGLSIDFEPMTFDFTQPSQRTPSKKCKPCTTSKEQKQRTTCYVKLVKERRNSSNDTSRKWRKIKCR